MKAVIFRGINDLRLEEIAEPQIEHPADAIIKLTTLSICASDLHIKHQGGSQPGTIMGHEYCGEVIETGNQVTTLKKGDRVAGRPAFSCGHCYYCDRQQHSLCPNGGIFGGGAGISKLGVQAEYARIPYADSALTAIPDGLKDEDVIFCGDILSTGLTGVIRSRINLGDTLVIFGAGPVGLCAAACAPMYGPGLTIIVDLVDYRLEAAKKFGALTINSSREDPVSRIRELTEGRGADAVIEAVGSAVTLKASLAATRKGGTLSILGTPPAPSNFDLSQRFFDMFSLNIGLGELNHVDRLMRLIGAGKLDLRSLITHTFPLRDALQAYAVFEKKEGNCIKVLLKNE
jgi:alcohol dehydrogenase